MTLVRADRTAARAERAARSNLTLRVASAAVLAPVTLAITYAGGWIFLALCAIAAGGILWEWTSLVSHRADPRILAPGWAALLGAAGAHRLALARRRLGRDRRSGRSLAGSIVAAWPRATTSRLAPAIWAAGGVVYAGALAARARRCCAAIRNGV